MTPDELLTGTSPRQLDAMLAWAEDEWNRPSRTDHYLMLVATEVLRGRVKNPGRVRMKDMRLKFGPPAAVPVEVNKAGWVGIVGGSDAVVERKAGE